MADHAQYDIEVRNFFNNLPKDHFELTRCPLCPPDSKYIHMFLKDQMQIVRCECGLVYNANQPTQRALNMFYEESKAMLQWSEIKKGQKRKQAEKFQRAAEFLGGHDVKSVMDVGCGNGVFLSHCKEAGVKDIHGIEMSGAACALAKKTGASISQVNIDTWLERDDKQYDAVSLWGVLEHLKEPVQMIRAVKEKLKPRGYLVICVPNVESTVVERLWALCSTFCPQHLWYFRRRDVENILYKEDYKVIDNYCIEAETLPSKKQLLGLHPYEKYPDWVHQRFLDEQKSSAEMTLMLGKGYKTITIGRI